MAPASHSSEAPNRPTRTRRSRYGCRNCKLRKLKCDETKPRCKKCVSFGVVCNYMSNLPDLEPIIPAIGRPAGTRRVCAPGATRFVLPRTRHQSVPRPPISSAIWTCDMSGSYRFDVDARSQSLVSRYLSENMVGSYEPNMGAVFPKLLKLAIYHPFLMHACIAGALAYDRYMHMISRHQQVDRSCTPQRSLEECYHLSQSTVLLNKHLNSLFSTGPVHETSAAESEPPGKGRGATDSRDPIWGTASLLALVTFSSSSSSRDASTPEDSWPLLGTLGPACPSSSAGDTTASPHTTASGTSKHTNKRSKNPRQGETQGEFNWSAMTTSKLSLWGFVQPLREDSIFSVVATTFADMNYKLPESGIEGIPEHLSRICGLTPNSSADASPYFLAAHAVAHLYNTNGDSIATPPSSKESRPRGMDGESDGVDSGTSLFNNETTQRRQFQLPVQKDYQPEQHRVKIGSAKVFTRIVTGHFESLLRDRDPVALLLFYLWYSKARQGIWWIELRARVEVPAIRLYLRRFHSERQDILGLIRDT